MVSGARGRVLDLGGGDGSHLLWYGDADEVVLAGVQPNRLASVRFHAAASPARVTVLGPAPGSVDVLHTLASLADASFDTVISTFALSTTTAVPTTTMLGEVARLGRRGFVFRCLEYAPPRSRVIAALVDVFAPPGAARPADPVQGVRDAGFTWLSVERFQLPFAFAPWRRCVLGCARPSRSRGPAEPVVAGEAAEL